MELTENYSENYSGKIEAFYRSLPGKCSPWLGVYVEKKLDNCGNYSIRLLHNSRGIDGTYWQKALLNGSEIMGLISGKLRIIPLRHRDKIGYGYFKVWLS